MSLAFSKRIRRVPFCTWYFACEMNTGPVGPSFPSLKPARLISVQGSPAISISDDFHRLHWALQVKQCCVDTKFAASMDLSFSSKLSSGLKEASGMVFRRSPKTHGGWKGIPWSFCAQSTWSKIICRHRGFISLGAKEVSRLKPSWECKGTP